MLIFFFNHNDFVIRKIVTESVLEVLTRIND